MDSIFGEHFIMSEWEYVIDPMTKIWDSLEEECDTSPELLRVYEEAIKRQGLFLPPPKTGRFSHYFQLIDAVQDERIWASSEKRPKKPGHSRSGDLRHLDLGVIDLTILETAQDSVTTGSGPDIIDAGPSKQKRRRSDADQHDNTAAGLSKATKRRRTVARHRISHFLDVSALDEDEDEDDDDDGDEGLGKGDSATDSPAEALEATPGGRVSFASRLEDICRQYEEGPSIAGHNVSSPLSHSRPELTPGSSTRVYKVDILIGIDLRTLLFHSLIFSVDSAVDYIRAELNRKSFKIIPDFFRCLYVEASDPKAIITSIPPSHRDVVRNIVLVPTEDVPSLYSTREVFTSPFWVRVKRGVYKNDIGYVLSRDGDKVDVLLAPQERPYDSDRRKLLFDIDAARRAGYAVTVTEPPDVRAGVVTCRGLVYQQGLVLRSFTKLHLEVVEAPHPDDLAFHYLAGIDLPLIRRTVAIFSAQLWQEGDLVRVTQGELNDACGPILSVDLQNKTAIVDIESGSGLTGEFSFSIFHLQRKHRRGDSVKVFAGSDRGVEGFVVIGGENLTLAVHREGETIQVLFLP